MKRFVILMLIAVVSLAASASAFDGARKGFVLGGGLGFAPVAKYEWWILDESKAAVGLNFVIGYAWDEANMIVYEGNVVGYKSDLFNDDFAQGFNGAAWYHYFGMPGKSFYSVAGLGFCVLNADRHGSRDPGFGILVGAGYEFARHWQVGAYFSSGKTTATMDPDMDHSHFSFLVSTVAF